MWIIEKLNLPKESAKKPAEVFKKFEEFLTTNEVVLQEWVVLCEAWEKARSEGAYGKSAVATAQGFQSESMTLRKSLGFLWPLVLYKLHFGGAPRDHNRRIQTVNGVRGVILPASFGTPLGVAEVVSENARG
jgi:hypothetical protein